MTVNYTIWFKDRETRKCAALHVTEFHVTDILETAHDLLLSHTDNEYICYRVDLNSMANFNN